jgi:hypothetical protein
VALRTFQSRVGVGRWKLSAGGRHHQPVRVHRNVAAERSEGNLPRRLWVRVPVKREAEKSEANRESINLQPRRPPVRVLAKREVEESEDNLASIELQPHRLPAQAPLRREAEEREGKVPMVNLAGSQGAERHLLLSKDKGRRSRSAERKKKRGLHRQGHNNSS